MGKNDDPFKVDLKTGDNLEKEDKPNAENSDAQEPVGTKSISNDAPLTKKELRAQKRRERERVRVEERKFEREAGMLKAKSTSLTFSILGTLASLVPIITYVGILLLVLVCALATTALFLLFLVGFFIIAPIYLSSGRSLSDYFAIPTAPVEFASGLFNTLSGLSGLFLTVAAAIGLGFEIIALVLFFASAKALCKRNKIKRAILLSFGIIVGAIVLIIGIVNL